MGGHLWYIKYVEQLKTPGAAKETGGTGVLSHMPAAGFRRPERKDGDRV